MASRAVAGLLLATAATCLASDSSLLQVPSGTKVRIEITQRTRLEIGQPTQARLLEPIFVDNQLAVPFGASLSGYIAAVHPAPAAKRLDAKFHGDFTPLGEPVIQFTGLNLAGEHYPVAIQVGGGAGTTLYFRSASAGQKSLFRRLWESVTGREKSAVETVKAPGKAERLKAFFWSQMPYHPQSVQAGAQYEASFASHLELPASEQPPAAVAGPPVKELVSVQGRLRTPLDSAKAKPGDPVEAVVTQPVFDQAHELLIPQGTVLRGKVLQAAPAGPWGRNGLLRFSFNEIKLPAGFRQNVEGVPTAISASPGANLRVDHEGGVSQPGNHSVMEPLALGLLAGAALTDDEAPLAHSAVASNGFAIVGRVIAIASGSRYVGGAIGAVATSRSVYTHWLAHGKNLRFGDDTEVQLQLSPERARQLPLTP